MRLRIAMLMTVASTSVALGGQTEIDAIRARHKLPALAATLVAGETTTTYVSGVRKWDDTTLALKTDKFHLGSCTKAMTATVLAMYVEKGLLTWDSTMETLFPEYASEMNADMKKVSVAMLTAHRSGITGDLIYFQSGQLWLKLWDQNLDPVEGRKLVAHAVLSAAPVSVPSSKYEYSNANYMITGAILEKITKARWEDLMRDNLFKPLGMDSCGFGPQANPEVSPPGQPWPHVTTDGKPTGVTPDFFADNPPALGPAGTAHCSIEDWAKFARFHIDGFNGKSTSLLSTKSFQKLHESYPGQEYTYGGWMRVNRAWAGGPALTHGGSNTLNFAKIWIAPLQNAALLSTTNIGGNVGALATDEAIGVLLSEMPKQANHP